MVAATHHQIFFAPDLRLYKQNLKTTSSWFRSFRDVIKYQSTCSWLRWRGDKFPKVIKHPHGQALKGTFIPCGGAVPCGGHASYGFVSAAVASSSTLDVDSEEIEAPWPVLKKYDKYDFWLKFYNQSREMSEAVHSCSLCNGRLSFCTSRSSVFQDSLMQRRVESERDACHLVEMMSISEYLYSLDNPPIQQPVYVRLHVYPSLWRSFLSWM